MENNLTFTVERLNPGTIGQDLAERRWRNMGRLYTKYQRIFRAKGNK